MELPRARDMAGLARGMMADVGSEYLQSSFHRLDGQISVLEEEWPKAVELLSSAVFQAPRDASPWTALDAQIWCFQAAMHSGADDVAAKALSCAVSSRLRWPREHPRVLEAAAAWLVRQGRNDPAARAWLQASAIRSKKGIVRFPVERAMSEQTCSKLALSFGPEWPSEWQTRMPDAGDDDPLVWLAGETLTCSTRRSQVPVAANDRVANARAERALAEPALGSGE